MGFQMDWMSLFALNPATGTPWWRYMAEGLWVTVALTASAGLLAFVVGSVIGVIRTVPNRVLNIAGEAWVEFFRNIPLLVQLFLWYFVVPEFIPPLKAWIVEADPIYGCFVCALLGLGLFTSVRVAENVKSGILSIPRGQRLASEALGLSTWQTYRCVLLPIAFRITLPPLTSEAMNLMKNTAATLAIGLADLTYRPHEMGEMTFEFFVAFCFATVAYMVLALVISQVLGAVERMTAIPGMIRR